MPSQAPSLIKEKNSARLSLDSSPNPSQKGSAISPGSAVHHTTQQTEPQGTNVPPDATNTARPAAGEAKHNTASFGVTHFMLFSNLNPAYAEHMNKSIKAFGTPSESHAGL